MIGAVGYTLTTSNVMERSQWRSTTEWQTATRHVGGDGSGLKPMKVRLKRSRSVKVLTYIHKLGISRMSFLKV